MIGSTLPELDLGSLLCGAGHVVGHYCQRLWKCTIGGVNSCAHEILECANVILPCIFTISLTEAIPRYTEALIQLEL